MSVNVGSIHYTLGLDTSAFDKATDSIGSKMSGISTKLAGAGKKMSALVTLPIIGLGAAAFNSAADFEQLQVAFNTMLGSAEKAKSLLADLDKLAMKTPFEVTEVQDAAKQMLAYGIEADKIVETTRMLGDVASGLGVQTFPQLTLAFGQIKAKGKLAGQELLQLTNAGFNLAEAMGVTRGQLMDMMSTEEGVSFEQVNQAFISATSEGGRFFNMMQNQSETTSGKISNFKDQLTRLGRDIGTLLLPYAQQLVAWLSKLVQWFSSLAPWQQKTIVLILGIVAVIGPLLLLLSMLATGIKLVAAAFAFLAANPIVLIIAAIIAIVLALTYIIYQNREAIIKWVKDAINFVASIPDRIKNALGNLGNLLWNAGESIITGFLNGIKNKFEQVKNYVGGIGKWIKDHKGPLDYDKKLLVPAGGAIMQGLNTGLIAGSKQVQSTLSGITNSLSSPVMIANVAKAGQPQQSSTTTANFTGNIYLQDKSAVDEFFGRLSRNQELAQKGMATI